MPITGTMFTRVLTAKERERIQAYLARDGEKTTAIRQLVCRARRYMPEIKADVELLERLMARYG